MSEDCVHFNVGDRFVAADRRVWERREWGWKFLGFSKSRCPADIINIPSTDCDHFEDIIDGQSYER